MAEPTVCAPACVSNDPVALPAYGPGDYNPSEPGAAASAQRLAGAGVVTVPAGARAINVVVIAGTPTLSIDGAVAVTLPTGSNLSWNAEIGETLSSEFVFTGVLGTDFLVTTTA